MIWNDAAILQWLSRGGITPLDYDCINPASIDLRFSGKAFVSRVTGWEALPDGDLIMRPGDLYLMDTVEYVRMPPDVAGMLNLKSSIGRMGIEHLHAGWFDPAFHGTATLEMANLSKRPVTIEKGRRIVQLVLMEMVAAPQRSYIETGRYNGQTGPTKAR